MRKCIFALVVLMTFAQIACAASVTVTITDNCVGELGMQMFRGGAISGPWTLLTSPDLPPNSASYQDTNAPLGTVYYFASCVAGSEKLNSAAQSIVIKQMTGSAPAISLSQP